MIIPPKDQARFTNSYIPYSFPQLSPDAMHNVFECATAGIATTSFNGRTAPARGSVGVRNCKVG
jgi:hypothetical protein